MLRESNPHQWDILLVQEAARLAAKAAGYVWNNRTELAAAASFNASGAAGGSPSSSSRLVVGRLPQAAERQIQSLYAVCGRDYAHVRARLNLPNIASLESDPLGGKWKYEYYRRYNTVSYSGGTLSDAVIMQPFAGCRDDYYDIVICM